MGNKPMERITGSAETPKDTWLYLCDAEVDVTSSLPAECVMVIVAEPDSDKSPVRIRTTTGTWKELG